MAEIRPRGGVSAAGGGALWLLHVQDSLQTSFQQYFDPPTPQNYMCRIQASSCLPHLAVIHRNVHSLCLNVCCFSYRPDTLFTSTASRLVSPARRRFPQVVRHLPILVLLPCNPRPTTPPSGQ
ncbi:hypothetical protein E2C01_090878 [Portunus trituberculatus]|uniref:Uncharacterized protein n=1 Tax=Portunus trituberculatus TaxID=210409 RepID=A0A5B7JLI7_PORTR|nr:hypothetical protein [Portunus trituberculatus]